MLTEQELAEMDRMITRGDYFSFRVVESLVRSIRELQAERQALAGQVQVMRTALERIQCVDSESADSIIIGIDLIARDALKADPTAIERYVSAAVAVADDMADRKRRQDHIDEYRAARAAVKGGK